MTSRIREFALPDLGEGLTEAEVGRWLVAPGDRISLNQPLVEVETAKAVVEIPSPYAGVVTELLRPEGSTVDVGALLVRVDTGAEVSGDAGGASGEVAGMHTAGAAANPAESVARVLEAAGGAPLSAGGVPVVAASEETSPRDAVLVGYGVRAASAHRRPRRPSPPTSRPTPGGHPPAPGPALAAPPVRRLARTLGVDLSSVVPTGTRGTVTRADVEGAAAGRSPHDRPADGGPAHSATPSASGKMGAGDELRAAGVEPDAGGVEPGAGGVEPGAASAAPDRTDRRIPVRGVRRATAAAMVASAFSAPHVTVFTTADVTASVELSEKLRRLPEFSGAGVMPLLIAARALVLACRRHPEVNSSWDEAGQEIVLRGVVNLGLAVATDRGLLVPNIRDADLLTMPDLGRAMVSLVRTARSGGTRPSDLQNGTISITNIGTFGVDTGTPIINPGEAAILCLGAVRPMPWVHEGAVVPRQVMQLSLSFDHRLVDGELGANVLADVAAALTEPARLLGWG